MSLDAYFRSVYREPAPNSSVLLERFGWAVPARQVGPYVQAAIWLYLTGLEQLRQQGSPSCTAAKHDGLRQQRVCNQSRPLMVSMLERCRAYSIQNHTP